MPPRSALLLPLAASLLVLYCGCGSPEHATAARNGRIAVTLDDFRFEPQAIRASPGNITFTLRNRGRLAHTFRLRIEGRPVVEVPSMLPGEGTVHTASLKRGTYRIFCALANHEELGMYGTLTIR
jgi:plastocyanin